MSDETTTEHINSQTIPQEDKGIHDLRLMRCGRREIVIPCSEINKETLTTYMSDIMSVFISNVNASIFLDDYYRGKQGIREKVKEVRPTIDNKVCENHAFEMVEFLKGYMYGKPLKYAQVSEDKMVDDIELLNTYMLDQKKASKDSTMMEWLGKARSLLLFNITKRTKRL